MSSETGIEIEESTTPRWVELLAFGAGVFALLFIVMLIGIGSAVVIALGVP